LNRAESVFNWRNTITEQGKSQKSKVKRKKIGLKPLNLFRENKIKICFETRSAHIQGFLFKSPKLIYGNSLFTFIFLIVY